MMPNHSPETQRIPHQSADNPPSEPQTIDTFPFVVVQKLNDIQDSIVASNKTIQTLSETLAIHVKQNIDTFQAMQNYIGEQMNYRLFRQGIEENNLALELAKRNLELEFLQKKYINLEQESKADDNETERLSLETKRQQLEIEALQKNLDLLRTAKHSTQEKIKSVSISTRSMYYKMRDTIVYTAVGTVTAAAVGGIIAFIVWLIRFYIESTPK